MGFSFASSWVGVTCLASSKLALNRPLSMRHFAVDTHGATQDLRDA